MTGTEYKAKIKNMNATYKIGDTLTSTEAAALGLDTYALYDSVCDPMDSDDEDMQRFSGKGAVAEVDGLELEIRCEYEIPGEMLEASGWTDACSDYLKNVTPDFVIVDINEA